MLLDKMWGCRSFIWQKPIYVSPTAETEPSIVKITAAVLGKLVSSKLLIEKMKRPIAASQLPIAAGRAVKKYSRVVSYLERQVKTKRPVMIKTESIVNRRRAGCWIIKRPLSSMPFNNSQKRRVRQTMPVDRASKPMSCTLDKRFIVESSRIKAKDVRLLLKFIDSVLIIAVKIPNFQYLRKNTSCFL